MESLIQRVEAKFKKSSVIDVRSGDTVRVHQKIIEGDKSRIQIFEGTVIRTDRKNSVTSRITVRRIASGIGVEKSYLLHSPNVVKIEVTKRSKVRRNYLSYLRKRSGKSTRLTGTDFDRIAVNTLAEVEAPASAVKEEAPAEEVEAKPEKAAKAEAEAEPKADKEA